MKIKNISFFTDKDELKDISLICSQAVLIILFPLHLVFEMTYLKENLGLQSKLTQNVLLVLLNCKTWTNASIQIIHSSSHG